MSSLKELVRRWYPDVLTQRGWKQGSHRALDDIRESIAELQLYRSLVFADADAVQARLEALRALEAAGIAAGSGGATQAGDDAPPA